MPSYGNQWFASSAAGGFYSYQIEHSCRFDRADTSYLYRTQGTGSSQRTWTFSTWFKRGNISSTMSLLSSGTSNEERTSLFINSDDTVRFFSSESSSVAKLLKSNAVLRDPSAWYHFVFVVDSRKELQINRCQIYRNGKLESRNDSQQIHTQDYETAINAAVDHYIGRNPYASSGYFDGYMTDMYFVDGYALGPENFGEYKEGVWIPKAYAGPPPIVSDSSSQNSDIVFNGAGAGHLNYDKAYIGESSIEFGNSNAYSATIGSASRIESDGPFDFTTEDWTIDFWIRPGAAVSGSHVTVLHAEGTNNAAPSSADFYDFVWLNFDASGAPTLYVYFAPDSGGVSLYASASLSNIYGTDQWMHISVIRDNGRRFGQASGQTIAVFGNGVQYTLGINSGAIAQTDDLTTATVMDGKGMTLFGNNVYGYTSQTVERKLDEFRIVKGEARPPRFYFGTEYGDASGGVLPQRATSANRFTDDERTVLLVSGQSANVHARAVSLVDESGNHLDNVHFSNSSTSVYPSEDGVGKQFTMSGPQNTTREAFVGNTSSIVYDGTDDNINIADSNDWNFDNTQPFTWDVWFNIDDKNADSRFFSQYVNSSNRWYWV